MKVRLINSENLESMIQGLAQLSVSTICVSGSCPNRPQCFSSKRVSVLILGQTCTRTCKFCGVRKSARGDRHFSYEIEAVSNLVERLGLEFLVITSVTRDDLPDYGAGHFIEMVSVLRARFPFLKIELLIPDFLGDEALLYRITSLDVDIIGHNMETIARLYPIIRPLSDYKRSLNVIRFLAENSRAIVKSSIMLGLGEEFSEIMDVLRDIYETGCRAVCIGQYLPPKNGLNYPVRKYYNEREFDYIRRQALEMGFSFVWSGPFVRSSFVGGDSGE